MLPPTHRRTINAFSLVELLIVIGIIAVLIALLLPVLSKARRQALQVACLSNLRQLGCAFIAYAHENKGWFPGPANLAREQVEDWVYWQPGRDETEGRIFNYLNKDLRVLTCPSGLVERPTEPPYPFSYSVNFYFTGNPSYAIFGSPAWSIAPCKLTEVVESSRKVMVIEEDVAGINDGQWCADDVEEGLTRRTSLSVIHDKGREYGGGNRVDPLYEQRGRGNVVFADGHCDFIDRDRLLRRGLTDPGHDGGPY